MYMAKNVGICYYMSMTLKDRIPKEFYSLFRTKNMDAYMQIVVALYDYYARKSSILLKLSNLEINQ